MIKFLGIMVVAVIKTLLCKGIALAVFLLSFWIKGRKLKFNSDRWDDFFLQLEPKTVMRYAKGIYAVAAVISSVVSYYVLEFMDYRYSLEIALILFAGGVLLTACKWHIKGKAYLLKRYQEIPETILERKNNQEN